MMARRLRANRSAAGGGGGLPPVSEGLVGWWPCDDEIGSLTALDKSGNGNDAVSSGSADIQFTDEQGFRCAYFAAGALLQVPQSALYNGLSEITVCAQIITPGSTRYLILEAPSSGTRFGWYLYMSSTRAIWGSKYASSADTVTSTISISTNAWAHVGGAGRSDGDYYVFANGLPGGDTGGYLRNTPNIGWSFGKAPSSSTYQFTGSMRDIRIYNRGVTDQEMLDIANGVG